VIEVHFQPGELRRQWSTFARSQAPFATARALTWTAKAAQEDLQDSLPGTFTIRNGWTAKGIRIKPASKAAPVAAVGTKDEYLARQVTGGQKTSRSGRSVAVPVRARRNKRATTPRSRWPGAMIARKRSRMLIQPSANGRSLLLFSVRGREGHEKLRLEYVLTRTVKVESAWNLQRIAFKAFRREWPAMAARSWEQALQTAKRRRR
jgi:hypothetical protein